MLLAGGKAIDRPAVLQLLRDGTKGLLQDKARVLMLLAALGDPTSLSKVGAEEYDTAFTQGCAAMVHPPSNEEVSRALDAVRFLRRLISLQSSSSMLRSGAGFAGQSQGQGALLSNIFGAAQNRASSLITKATSFFTKFIPSYVSRVGEPFCPVAMPLNRLSKPPSLRVAQWIHSRKDAKTSRSCFLIRALSQQLL